MRRNRQSLYLPHLHRPAWAFAPRAGAHGAAVLALLGLLSALIYWICFTRPLDLRTLYAQPLLDLSSLARRDPLLHLRLLSGYLLAGALYVVGWIVAGRARGPAAWAAVIGGAFLSTAALLPHMPVGAADLFDNIMHARILGIHGANPFLSPPAQFQADPFLPYAAWPAVTSAYGPGWELAAAGVARLAGDGVVANVLASKLLLAAFLAASTGLVAAILARNAPAQALRGLLLLAWNPIVLVETIGEGHNDIALVACVLLAAWAMAESRHVTAIIALVAGGLVKFIPLLLIPAAAAIALRRTSSRAGRMRFLALAGGLGTALFLAAYAPFWHGPQTLSLAWRQSHFTTSLPAVAYAYVEPMVGKASAARGISLAAAALTGAFALWQAHRAGRQSGWRAFPGAAYNILMFYLLFTCPWFQGWYAIWPLGVAALLPGGAGWLAVLLGYAALAKPFLFGPLWFWSRPLPPKAWRELRLGPAVLAGPWLAAVALWLWARRSSGGRRIALRAALPFDKLDGRRDHTDDLLV